MSNTVVIIVNYHGAADTAACIDSLLSSKERPGLIVVDNTPNDPNLERVVGGYPEAKLIRAKENLGFGRGVNLGVRNVPRSKYRFILVLNNDARVGPETVINLERAMAIHPEAGIVAPRIVLFDQQEKLWYGGGEVDWLRGGGRVPGIWMRSDSGTAMTGRNVSFASGCAMLVRREVFERIGGFDPRFFMYEEDLEFCLRAIEHNYVIRYTPDAIVYHRWQGSLRGEGEEPVPTWDPRNPRLSFYVFHIVRNRLLNMKLHAKGKNAFLFYVGFPMVLSYKALSFVRHGAFKGVLSIIRGIGSYYMQRNALYINELEGDA